LPDDIELRREERPGRLWDWLDATPISRWLDGVRPLFGDEDVLRIEQQVTDDTMVIKAELPGIDPDKDVEISVDDGVLRIHAERRSSATTEEQGTTRSEFRYGSFSRTLRVPKDMAAEDVSATYKDGILEVRFPFRVPTAAPPTKVPVSRA
jgi:HSP20 family protein